MSSHAPQFTLTLESTDFPADRVEVRKVAGTEAVSRLYDLEVSVVCLDHDGPSVASMTGAQATLVVECFERPDGGWHGTRRISGMIAEAEDLLYTHKDFRAYRLRLVPRAFALALVDTQDVFVGAAVPTILRQKLAAVGLANASALRLTGSYAPRDLTIQYKETDLAFVSRLSEHLGIAYFFEQGDAGDVIVFADNPSAFAPVEGAASLVYQSGGAERDVFALTAKQRVVPGYHAVRDYNYQTPAVDISGESEIPGAYAGGSVEWGTNHATPADGQALAAVRAEEAQAGEIVYTGRSAVAALTAGTSVTITDHPDLGSIDLIVTEVTHHAVQEVANASLPDEPGYVNTFRAIPAGRMFRPPRVTPRPRIAGVVPAVVDPGPPGPSATYAQIDDQGRYLVRFLFDLTPRGHRPTSCPVRMLQGHAGAGYGVHFPLKPGVEVAVAFVDGDPDRPLIVGAAPNPITPSPVTSVDPGFHRIVTSSGIVMAFHE